MRKPKIVLDTNVLVSALLFPKSELREIYDAWLDGKFELIISKPLHNELITTLIKLGPKYHFTPQNIMNISKRIYERAVWVKLKHIPKVVRDPKDDMVVATAVAAKADFLITGDKDILTLGKSHRKIKIRKPADFPV